MINIRQALPHLLLSCHFPPTSLLIGCQFLALWFVFPVFLFIKLNRYILPYVNCSILYVDFRPLNIPGNYSISFKYNLPIFPLFLSILWTRILTEEHPLWLYNEIQYFSMGDIGGGIVVLFHVCTLIFSSSVFPSLHLQSPRGTITVVFISFLPRALLLQVCNFYFHFLWSLFPVGGAVNDWG